MISIRIIVVIFLLSLTANFNTSNAQTQYRIEGYVYGSDSKPLPNIVISLQNQSHIQVSQDITTSDGRYQFTGIAAGTYYLIVKARENEFQSVSHQVELLDTSRGGNIQSMERVDFTLKAVSGRTDSNSAETVFAQAVPPEAENEYLVALKNLKKAERDQAIDHLKNAIKSFPTYYLALRQLGFLYLDVNGNQEAIQTFSETIKVNPKSADAHLGLGMAYVNLGEFQVGVAELETARSLDARLTKTYLYLGIAQIGLNNLDLAEQTLKQAYAIAGPVEGRSVHLYLASVYDKKKEYQKAVDELETYLRENPKAANAGNIRQAIQKLKAKS